MVPVEEGCADCQVPLNCNESGDENGRVSGELSYGSKCYAEWWTLGEVYQKQVGVDTHRDRDEGSEQVRDGQPKHKNIGDFLFLEGEYDSDGASVANEGDSKDGDD